MSPISKTTFFRNQQIKRTYIYLSLVLASSLLLPSLAKSHDGHSSSHGVKVEELVNSTNMWDGNRLPSYPHGQTKVKILQIQIPSGVTLPWHYHPVINAAVILEGTLELKLKDGSQKIYRKGDALIEVVNTIHAGKALGTNDVVLVVFYAGEEGIPTTVLSDPQTIQ